ncbi:MAG: hypothetical protein EAY79_01310 [Runella slithyformis]|nr:MAG: hypothetical protein EAY79_01310 [Runella slithyformis]
MWYPFGRRFGNLGECNGIYKNLHFFRLLFLIPKQNTQKPNTQKMKKLTYLLLALMISQSAFAQNKFWTGTTNSDWNTASNWSPSGVPTSSDDVYLNGGTNSITISSGTITVKSIQLRGSGRTLTVNSGATLRLIGDTGAYAVLLMADASSLVNNGTVALETSGGGAITGWMLPSPTTTFTNSGTLRINTTFPTAIEMGHELNNTGGTTGTTAIINNACGKIILVSGDFILHATPTTTVTNAGLIQIAAGTAAAGTITNQNGSVFISGSVGSPITNNNGSVTINNNATNTSIFTYTGTFTGTVNGIFSNAAATTSAGTFTAPNTFTPSGSLPTGSQTLYAKITPSGGACNYVVPFTYNNVVPPTITAGAVTNAATCGGATGNIAFTATNVPNGTYSLTFTTTGTSSPQNVTVSNNAFTLSSLTAGSYNNFSLTVSGQTATTGVLSPAKIVSNPAAPTLTVGTATNPTTCAGTNGSIAFTSTNLPNGTYQLSFMATGVGATTSPQNVMVTGNAFSLISLSVGSYSGFSLTSTGCAASDVSSKSITNPTTPTLTPGVAVNPTSCGGTNGSIPFTTNLPDGTYSLSYTGTGSPKSINVSSGAFTLGTLGSGGMAISR